MQTVTVVFAATEVISFLIGCIAVWLMFVPLRHLVINSFTRAIGISLISMVPVGLGLLALGLVADYSGSNRKHLLWGFTLGAAAVIVVDRHRRSNRRR